MDIILGLSDVKDLDFELIGILVSNMLQSLIKEKSENIYQKEDVNDIQDSKSSQTENGVCVYTSINHGTSSSSPGKYREAVCIKDESCGTGLAERANQNTRWRFGTFGNTNIKPGGFQIAGGRCGLQLH
jgi:hypothetical protein